MATSWQARVLNRLTRVLIRRRTWGRDEWALAKRARRVFGAPAAYGSLLSAGVSVRTVNDAGVRGEWLVPRRGVPRGGSVVLYIHGGGYVACSRRTHRPITAALARRTGVRVLSIDYRLAPEHRYPAAVDDVLAAYRWLLRTSAPPPLIALAGDSAGGGLAMALLLRVRDEGLPMPACVVCFSPLADVRPQRATPANVGRDHMFHPENTEAFASAYLGAASRELPEVSLVNADTTGWPPMLFQAAETEMLRDDATAMHERVLASGGQSTLSVYGDVLHCWQMLVGILPEAGAALDEAAAFLIAGLARQRTG
jgi:acetyl esterase/lipase